MDNQLLKDLATFTGTLNYHRCWLGYVYTDGVKYLAMKANCYQKKFPDIKFQIWELNVRESEGVVTMKEDSDLPFKVTQEIKHTDFPLDYIKLYFIEGVLLLASEY